MDKEQIWQKARMYDELSHHYSNIADIYIKLFQELEDNDETTE